MRSDIILLVILMKYSKELPSYTKGEEIFNAVSHIVGGGFGIAALTLGVIFAAIYSNVYGVVSMSLFGATLVLLYTMSSIYHFLRPNKAKKVFRILKKKSRFGGTFFCIGNTFKYFLCNFADNDYVINFRR